MIHGGPKQVNVGYLLVPLDLTRKKETLLQQGDFLWEEPMLFGSAQITEA